MEPTPPPSPAPATDYLGYGVYADTLWARIARALDVDADGASALGDDPLVVGIFGEWGAGKSKLLSLVLERARGQSRRDIAERVLTATSGNPLTVTVPVFFQPWKYEHERHLHVPLAVHIADALKDAWKELPTDIEQLRAFVDTAGKAAQEVEKTLKDAGDKLEKTKGFLDGAYGALKSRAGAVVAGTTDIMLTSVGVPPLASLARKKILDALSGEARDEEGGEGGDEGCDEETGQDGDTGTPGGKASKKRPAKADAAPSGQASAPDDPWAWKDDGLGFYRMQRNLQALTRPKLKKELLQKAGITVTPGIEFDLRVNFVIFIDDLDRCLPEKAVETLELIKTVFNLESFAFVLALDEEVIERGIGHRYMAYNLAGKKPEMPITGFEYLEKIVHLPFRLPSLTVGQAAAFVRRYEAALEKEPARRWFAAPAEEPQSEQRDNPKVMRMARASQLDLLPLALSSFEHYVPRKLIRMVELMHHLAEVAARPRHRPVDRQYGTQVDPRVVLALVLLQLFQPELYRFMRRRPEAFAVFLNAFVPVQGDAGGKPGLSATHVSNADLCDWVVESPSLRNAPPDDAAKLVERLSHAIGIEMKNSEQRLLAQSVKLPLVALLLAHRAVQRHAFDPVRLFQTLAMDMHHTGHDPGHIVFRPYLTLLGEQLVRDPFAAKLNRHRVHSVQPLFDDLTSTLEPVQANILSRHEIPEDAYLSVQTLDALTQQVDAWMHGAAEKSEMQQTTLLRGLYHLAPAVAPGEGDVLWACVEGLVQLPDKPGQALADAKLADLYADARSRMGLDDRFDPDLAYLPRLRVGVQEPLPGFVKISKGAFTIGLSSEDDNPPRTAHLASDFYIARYLTTVNQYAQFVQTGGYDQAQWWDTQGWAWRQSAWASEAAEPRLREWLHGRSPAQRTAPMWWADQGQHGSRPVIGVNWFEARAYARWLHDWLATRTGPAGNRLSDWRALTAQGYAVLLPTEQQWERAARALGDGAAGISQFPWGDEEPAVSRQLANLADSDLGRASSVGVFAPGPMGLHDMAGNVWEWQDNLYQNKGRHKAWDRVAQIKGEAPPDGQVPDDWLLTDQEWLESALPALRGGSWRYPADHARASIRDRDPPDGWGANVGFRVVLSLP